MQIANRHLRHLSGRVVAKALKDGTLTRPSLCSACGKDPGVGLRGRTKIHAHHTDYARPMDVVWLCGSCHRHEHARITRSM